MEGKKWVQVKSQGDAPKVSPCFHSVEVYKNNAIVVGGIDLEGA
jgi:hypothetical protein